MKEILYYDEQTLNSILSQFGGGIIKSLQIEENEVSTDTQNSIDDGKLDSGVTMNLKLSSGVLPGGEVNLGGKFGGQTGVSYGSSQSLSEGQRDVIEKIFHDHALDLLLEKLDEKYSLTTNSSSLEEGDFTYVKGSYRYYDFELLTKITNPEMLKRLSQMAGDNVPEEDRNKIMKFGTKVLNGNKLTNDEKENKDVYAAMYQSILKEKAAIDIFNNLNLMSTFYNDVINGLVLFKIDQYVVIGQKDKMRIASEALSFRTDSSVRELKVLGRVIGVKDSNIDMAKLLSNFRPEDFDKIPSLMLDILLKALGISQSGDIIINPVAIYYEET